jgi:amidase
MTRAAIESGQRLGAAPLSAVASEAAVVAYSLAQRFLTVDVILTPMLAGAPPLLGSWATDGSDIDRHLARIAALAPYGLIEQFRAMLKITTGPGQRKVLE